MLVELKVQPGVYRNGSVREAKGRYYDANLVRWKNGKMKPIGGWEKTTPTALTGKGRTMLPFRDNAGFSYIAVGTSSALYIYTGKTSTPTDISPSTLVTGNESSAVGTGFGSGPFNGTTVYKSYTASTISASTTDDSFNDSADGFSTTDFKVNDLIQVSGFTGAYTGNNKTYANSHKITAITASKITVAGSNLTDATAAQAGEITISKARNFGEDYSGTSLVSSANVWSFDMWGEMLIACSDADGKIYYWNPSANDPLTVDAALVNTYAPTSNTSILVSRERHLIAFGAGGNPKKIQWCTSENFSLATNNTTNAWTPTVTNDAGSFEIDTTGKIKSAIKVADIILVNTDIDCHEMRYVSAPYIYSRRKIAGSCGIISRQAIAAVTGLAAWMSYDGTFFIYDGSVRSLPCDVSKHISDDMNVVQSDVFYASANSLNNEIWWFYVSASGSDIDRYVIWNYSENWWSIGQLERTAFSDIGVFKNPLGVSTNGFIYEHEKSRTGSSTRGAGVQDPATLTLLSQNDRTLSFGLDSSSSNEMCYAETGAFEVGIGERFANVKTMITDTVAGDNAISFKVYSALNSDSDETVSSSYAIGTDGYTHLRETGRHLRLKIQAPFDQDFEIGPMRAQVSAGARR